MASEFALSPGQLGAKIIKYTASEGSKLYKSPTAALETKFYLAQLKCPGRSHGWKMMLETPEDVNNNLENLHHIIDNYRISVEEVELHGLYSCNSLRLHKTIFCC